MSGIRTEVRPVVGGRFNESAFGTISIYPPVSVLTANFKKKFQKLFASRIASHADTRVIEGVRGVGGVIPVLRGAANLVEMDSRGTKRTDLSTALLVRKEKGIAQSSRP